MLELLGKKSMLKLLIIIVFLAILISLFTGLFFLFKDKENSKNLFISLSFRISLTLILLSLVTFGLLSGTLGNQAPWGQGANQSDDINKDK